MPISGDLQDLLILLIAEGLVGGLGLSLYGYEQDHQQEEGGGCHPRAALLLLAVSFSW